LADGEAMAGGFGLEKANPENAQSQGCQGNGHDDHDQENRTPLSGALRVERRPDGEDGY
jgi:hypothetical protein